MNLSTKIGSLAVIGLFSVTTLAQVATRPRPLPAEATRPEAIKPIDGAAAMKGAGSFGKIGTTMKAANDTAKVTCSREDAVKRLVQRTGLNEGIVNVGLNKLVIQGCQAGEEGLLNFKDDKAVKVAVLTGYYMAQNQIDGPTALAKAKTEVTGVQTTADAEKANYEALLAGNASSCNVFRN